jgi:hypothetical protein
MEAFTVNNVLKSSQVINRINVELKINISEISLVPIIRVDVVSDTYTGLTNQCLFPTMYSYYAVGVQSQTV